MSVDARRPAGTLSSGRADLGVGPPTAGLGVGPYKSHGPYESHGS